MIYSRKNLFPLIGEVLVRFGTRERQTRHPEHKFKEALAVVTLQTLALPWSPPTLMLDAMMCLPDPKTQPRDESQVWEEPRSRTEGGRLL